MILILHSRRWTTTLLSLSCFISNNVPSSCDGTTKRKDSLFVSDDNLFQRSYRLEDFFWTGSGDGPVLEDSFGNETDAESKLDRGDSWTTPRRTTTVFHTTSVLFATLYPFGESKPKISPVWTGTVEFSSPVHHPSSSIIKPSATVKDSDSSRDLTVFSEVTKILTVTQRISAGGGFQMTPTASVSSSSTIRKSNKTFSPGPSENDGESDGAAFPRLDVESNSTSSAPTESSVASVPLDQRYWLLTVLKRDSYSPELKVNVIEEKLSQLYRKAFIRQQEKHLGISNNSVTTSRPRRDRRIPEPVRVHIHNVTDSVSNDPEGVGLLYSVTVAGRPVPALTAANDMRLITVNEVVAELGYPVLTKAEPYLKGAVPLGSRVKGRTRDTWLLIASVIAAVSILIVLAALFTFGLSHRGANGDSPRSTANKKQIFEAEEGNSNLAFQEESDLKARSSTARHQSSSSRMESSRAVESSAGTTVTFADQRRGSSGSSSCSGSSEASLVRLRHQQKKKDQRRELSDEKPRPRPRTRIRRVENVDSLTEEVRANRMGSSSALSRDRESYGGMTTEGLDDVELTPRATRTPTSYLSMPSVKAFPRGARIPEPLNRVLEPTSIRHLDGDSEIFSRQKHRRRVLEEDRDADYPNEREQKSGSKGKGMTRHASLEGDPGVIGPVVWKRHCLKTDAAGKDALEISEIDDNVSIGKMRKRFNDLIDDAFSMFGSRNESSEERDKSAADTLPLPRSGDSRIHSAVIRPVESFYRFNADSRPKTTDCKRPLTAINQGPRGAWDSPVCDAATRPAGSPRLAVDKSSVLVDSNLSPGDPAIPLIKAIKDELHKFDRIPAKCTDTS